ncbi:YdcF family protein [Candidatus Poribacteria bacterium]|nr:YdcF family protein [Candidatus Poribacteria bacterium]MYG07707.1 YdcF family protein [Candidatus Poribacteria bacterium]MYK23803.1 YdcF family protein [Candidatus Poribacteria bacterium]
MAQFPHNYENDLKNRSIPREVTVEGLSPEEIENITQTVFVTSDLHPAADLLFIFGTSTIDSDALESVARDCQQEHFPKVIVTGLSGRLYSETGKPVAHIMRDELIAHGVPSDLILVQDRSTNTLEDVAFSLDVLEKHSISPESIAFLCKAHHSGRCLRTLRKFFPSQTLLPVTYLAEYEGVKVSKTDWYQHEVSRGRVYGEYLRIIEYSKRGNIAHL